MVLIFNKFFDMPLYRYVKEHPDAKIHGDDDDDDDFDMGEIKEYRQLLQGQDKIHDVRLFYYYGTNSCRAKRFSFRLSGS